jgi:hypothetical protein
MLHARSVAQVFFHGTLSGCSEVQCYRAACIRLIPPSMPHETTTEPTSDVVRRYAVKMQLPQNRCFLRSTRRIQLCLSPLRLRKRMREVRVGGCCVGDSLETENGNDHVRQGNRTECVSNPDMQDRPATGVIGKSICLM